LCRTVVEFDLVRPKMKGGKAKFAWRDPVVRHVGLSGSTLRALLGDACGANDWFGMCTVHCARLLSKVLSAWQHGFDLLVICPLIGWL